MQRITRGPDRYRAVTNLDRSIRERAQPVQPRQNQNLDQKVARIKARWLKRVLYGSSASSTQKCLAYAIFDHLNCVTMDCWPSQLRLAQLLGFDSVKTVQRAARGLERLGFIAMTGGGRQGYRYVPVFTPEDEDNSVKSGGRKRPAATDKTVNESFLQIYPNRPNPSGTTERPVICTEQPYRRSQRGAVEVQLAEKLGPEGINILAKLGSIDDRIVERLCCAFAAGLLTDREIIAAKLAAEQVR